MDFEKLPFDIYLRLPSGRLVKVGKKGQAVLQESLERYAAKGVDHVLVETSELTRPEEEPPQQMEADPSTPPPPQLVALMEQSRGIYQNLHLLGFQASALKEANQVAEKASRFLSTHQDLLSILDKLRFFGDPIAAHSLAVGTAAVMIAKSQGWLQPSNFQKLFLGGLLHDIGLMMLPEEIRTKVPEEMTEKELLIYQTHPALGFKSLSRTPQIPKEVLSIVLEHHEGRKNGFPKGLGENEIHPMARLIAFADQFTDYVLGPPQRPGDAPLSIPEALKQLGDSPTFKREDLASLEKLALSEDLD